MAECEDPIPWFKIYKYRTAKNRFLFLVLHLEHMGNAEMNISNLLS